MDMREFDDLIESWTNGNKSHVAERVKRMKKTDAMLFAAMLADHGERLHVLISLMEAH